MRFVSIVFLLFCTLYANSPSGDAQERFGYFVDADRSHTIEEVVQAERFQPFPPEQRGFGLTGARYWVKMTLKNPSASPLQKLVTFEYPLLDLVEMYDIDTNGFVRKVRSGDSVPVSQHYLQDTNIVFPVAVAPLSEKSLYFRIDSYSSMNLDFEILDTDTYYKRTQQKERFLGFMYGGSFVMLLYNLFLFLSIRERGYLYYVLFESVSLLALMSLSGMAFGLFWPEYPVFNNALPFFIVMCNIMGTMFTRAFLETSKLMPGVDRWLKALLTLLIVIAAITLAFNYHIALISAVFSILVTTFSLVAVGFIALVKNIRASKFYLLAWIFLLLGAILTSFKNIGLLPITPLTTWGVQLGVFFEMILLSLGLADRINALRFEQSRLQEEAAQKAVTLANVLEDSKVRLEHKVKERTEELRIVNRQLRENVSSKEMLFRELHHRVKNNLQVIIAMMSLQKNRIRSPETQELFGDANKRLQSMSLVHEMLYRSDKMEAVDMKEYLLQLMNRLRSGYSEQVIALEYKLDRICLDLDTVISLGLIYNEIVTNAFKHAFKDLSQEHKLHVLLKAEEGKIVFGIKDNGHGFDGNFEQGSQFGMLLIKDLVSKLPNGRFAFKRWHGTYFRMEFSL